ncbi:MAG: Ig-like domain repeat protein, partial [Acidobacteriota bacterium]|nr:Ig-like domain repeat protein [Acidobacteriota bacterium]
MRFRKWQTALVCLVALALVAFAPVRRGRARAASSYTVTDLGVLNGDQKSVAYALDGCGRIAGVSILNQNDSSTPRHPVLWDDSQQPQPTPSPVIDMGTLGGSNATAFALNGFAVAVGDSYNASDDRHAFIWHDDNGNHLSDPGEMKDLGTLSGDSLSQAYGINDSSQVVGLSEDINGSEHAFIWSQATGMQAIAPSNGLTPFRAYAINNDGQIVGVALTASVAAHAYRLSHGTLTDLGTLGGRNSFANGINEAGLVVGNSDVSASGSSSRAFIWFPDTGNKTDLGTLTGGSNSIAYDINASGDAVGSSEVTGGASHAFIWHDADGDRVADPGDMQDLNTLTSGSGWTLQEARSINDSGQIVGYGLNPSSQPHAFLLTPANFTPAPCATPAPSSISNVSGSGVFNSTATLTATLLKSGSTPLSGKTVSFTLNGAAVCGTGSTPACPTTDSNGVATLAGVSLSGLNAGTYPVGASFAGELTIAASNGTGTLTVNRADQTISFGVLSGKTFGDPDFSVSANASSGLPVGFSATGNCTVNGSTVHITGAGTCTITASQPGNTNYKAAPDVAQSFTIAKASQTITFGPLGNHNFGELDFGVDATGGASGNPVTFSTQGNCTIVNSNNINLVHLTGAGSCSVTASQAGDSNYNAAASVTQSFTIFKASVIIFPSVSPNPSIAGQEVTLGAFIQIDRLSFSSPTAVPGGSVQFQVDGKDVGGPVTCSSGGLRNSCGASIKTSGLTAGSHGLRVNYSGDANFFSSTNGIGLTVQSGVEFTQATYTVGERDGSVSITVHRMGDTTSAASVDYATDDGSTPSVAVPCSSVTGLALERCDYTRAAGTLNFAPNETQKSFNVLVNDDSYAEGTETLSLRLSNPVGFVLGTQASATLQITDDQPESAGNPVDDPSFFVRQHYHDFLNREADQSGLNFWTGGITSCGTDSNCTAVKRVDTSAAFFLSIEFQDTGYLVERIYKTAFGDADGSSNFPSQHTLKVPVVRLREFLRDTQEIGSTPTQVIVGVGNWQQQLEDNKNAFVLEFVSRQTFRNTGLLSLAPAQYVDKLNANAGSVLTQAERDQLVSQLTTSDTPAARASVLRSIAENPVLNA